MEAGCCPILKDVVERGSGLIDPRCQNTENDVRPVLMVEIAGNDDSWSALDAGRTDEIGGDDVARVRHARTLPGVDRLDAGPSA